MFLASLAGAMPILLFVSITFILLELPYLIHWKTFRLIGNWKASLAMVVIFTLMVAPLVVFGSYLDLKELNDTKKFQAKCETAGGQTHKGKCFESLKEIKL